VNVLEHRSLIWDNVEELNNGARSTSAEDHLDRLLVAEGHES
jgi:hypothetical protein